MKTEALPEYLIVAAAGEFEPGLAVGLRFGMKQMNDFLCVVFIYERPVTLTKATLLEQFDQIWNLFPMDYADPRQAFDGEIDVHALTTEEIHAAIKEYHACVDVLSFPTRYLSCLEKALQINPKSDCLVACEKLY
jgi:hypothetical protein